MKMTFYGNNFVVYHSNENDTQTKDEILAAYTKWIKGMRQKKRILKDIEELKNLLEEGKKYSWTTRQWTGHRYFSTRMRGGKHIWHSRAICWYW